MWKTATPMLILHCPCNVGSPNRSCESGTGTKSLSAIRLTDRMRDVHKLQDITQSVPMLDENSALRPNMPQRDDDEGGKPKRLSF